MTPRKNTKPLDAEFIALVDQLRVKQRIGFATRFVAALRAQQRVWVHVLDEPICRVWLVSVCGLRMTDLYQ